MAASGWIYARIVLIVAAIVVLVIYLMVRSREFFTPTTRLKKHTHPRTGEVTRVYIVRKSLHAKLWLQKTATGFEVRHQGTDADFSVTSRASLGEAIHIREAREALQDVGLDINRCTWDDIVKKAV